MALIATDNNFQDEVLSASGPVLVDFWAEWCEPCRTIGPIVDEIGEEYKDSLKVMKLNVDENSDIPMKYKVMSIPTLIVFNGGNEVKRIVGAKPKAALLGDLSDFI